MGFLYISNSNYYSVRNVTTTNVEQLLNDSLPRHVFVYSLRNTYTLFSSVMSTSGGTMSIEVRKSPAGVCWWVCVNDNFLSAHERKWEAEREANYLRRRYA